MKIIETRDYIDTLKEVLSYIADDKKSAAIDFHNDLRQKIDDLKTFPFMYRVSIYFDDEYIRDLTHKGYTVPYKVDLKAQTITIIGITKYKNKLR